MFDIPCEPVPIDPITTRFDGAVLPPSPSADDGMSVGTTKIPAAAAAERFTNVLLDVFVDINIYII
jgi:hypothetical protein